MEEKILTDNEKNTETPALEDMFTDLEEVIGKMEGHGYHTEQSFELYNQGHGTAEKMQSGDRQR